MGDRDFRTSSNARCGWRQAYAWNRQVPIAVTASHCLRPLHVCVVLALPQISFQESSRRSLVQWEFAFILILISKLFAGWSRDPVVKPKFELFAFHVYLFGGTQGVFSCGMWELGSHCGSNPRPPHWECSLSHQTSGKSQVHLFFKIHALYMTSSSSDWCIMCIGNISVFWCLEVYNPGITVAWPI